MPEQAAFTIAVDNPDLRIVSTRLVHEQELLIEVESTLTTLPCHRCGRTIDVFDGYEASIRLQHTPMLGQPVSIMFRPKRFRCLYCEDYPVTIQQLVPPVPLAASAVGE